MFNTSFYLIVTVALLHIDVFFLLSCENRLALASQVCAIHVILS